MLMSQKISSSIGIHSKFILLLSPEILQNSINLAYCAESVVALPVTSSPANLWNLCKVAENTTSSVESE